MRSAVSDLNLYTGAHNQLAGHHLLNIRQTFQGFSYILKNKTNSIDLKLWLEIDTSA